MLADMGKALDWISEEGTKKGHQVTKVTYGPGKSTFVGLHPEIHKIMLKAGEVLQ